MASERRTTIRAEPGGQELVITREFDAPRELVFRAFTDPELFAQWPGPRRLKTTIETFVARSGGRWRYTQQDLDGTTYGFHGIFHEVMEPERMIQTWEFEGLPEPGHVVLEVAEFEALPGGRTRVVSQSVYRSAADRDGQMDSAMEKGLQESYERLDELLARLK